MNLANELIGGQLLQELWAPGSGADQCHVAAQHVYELWQVFYPGVVEPQTDCRGLRVWAVVPGLKDGGTELEPRHASAIATPQTFPEKHGAAALKFNRDGDDKQQGQGGDNQDQRGHHIRGPRDPVIPQHALITDEVSLKASRFN